MKKLILIAPLILMALISETRGQATGVRETLSLDRDWRFHLGHAGNPALDFGFGITAIFSKSGKAEHTAIDPAYNDSGWRQIDVPHDWAVELPFVFSRNFDVQSHGYKPVGGLYPETSIGWYRKSFPVSGADSGMRFSIRFDGVFRDARFWLNGFYLGRNESGYVGVSWDITDYLRFGRPNVLVVRVDATQYEGWFYEGAGIYRHVWLEKRDPLHIPEHGVFVRANPETGRAVVLVETELQNDHTATLPASVSVRIMDRNGIPVSEDRHADILMEPNSSKTISQRISFPSPKLWSPDEPCLYKACVTVRSGSRVTDYTTVRFGVRTVRFDADSGFFLNGKPMKLLGVCCHQDHAGVGSAVPDFLQYYRINLLKEMGVNAYRSSHNAPAPEILDACDSLGMLVMDEQRLLNSSPEYAGQFERLIRRDRNHPSVVIWSIGNEEGYLQTNSTGRQIAVSLMKLLNRLDPDRTCTYAADLPNVYTGVNEVIPVRGFNYRQFAVSEYHQSHPEQPIIGTEMGSTVTTRGVVHRDTVRCYLPDQDITAPWWASTAETWWTLCAEQPWFSGGFIWTGFDYRGEPTPFQWPNINSHFGIMDMCGFPKNLYYYYQSWWTDLDVLHLSPHWNDPVRPGSPVRVWVNSNAEEVELFLNGRSLGRKEMPENRHLEWEVEYQPGTLEAIGLKHGNKIRTRIETTGEPVRLVLDAVRDTLAADGSDGTVVNVTVVDAKGREVPDAGNLVRFNISGDARILGVGNGDPSSHEADQCTDGQWQRRLFNGKCQLILQAGSTAGLIQVEGRIQGLQAGTALIVTTARP